MNPVVVLSLVLRVAAVLLALLLWARRRDWRMGLVAAPLLALALSELPAVSGHLHPATGLNLAIITELLVSLSVVVAVLYLDQIMEAHDRALRALSLEKASMEQLFESAPDALVLVDNDSRILRLNSRFTRLFGYSIEEVRAQSVDGLLAPPELIDEAVAITSEAARGAPVDRETLRRCRDGSLVDVSISATPIIVNGEQVAVYGSYRDITDRKRVEQALRESEERYAIATRGTNDGLWDWDLRHDRIFFSVRWREMLGWSEEDVSERPADWFALIHPDDAERVETALLEHRDSGYDHIELEYQIRAADGTYHWVLTRGMLLRAGDGTPIRMAGSQTDISARKQTESQLLHDALHDALTGLSNRSLFMDRLDHVLAKARRRPEGLFAVLFLDLDRFKVINDSLGHLLGDRLLVEFGRRLLEAIRPGDTVARLGGDEFAILLEDLRESGEAAEVAERIQKDLAIPFTLDGQDVYTTTSIGIAFGVPSYDRPEQLLRDADTAMYRAKVTGKARHEVFDADMHADVLTQLQLETDLRRAVDAEQFLLHYQPILSLTTGRIVGFEALMRWEHPQRGLVSPGDFIPLAEETGLIVPIGWWVLEAAARQMKEWQQRFPASRHLSVSVNLSARLFRREDLHDRVMEILRASGLAPESLRLEITESALMDYVDGSVHMLDALRREGIDVQIDDFGTGYSSLNYLHRFNISALKIDRSFISRLGVVGENSEIARTIITLARNLGIKVVAEGVETREQLHHLKALGCDYGQGFLLSAPLTPGRVEERFLCQPGGEPRIAELEPVLSNWVG